MKKHQKISIGSVRDALLQKHDTRQVVRVTSKDNKSDGFTKPLERILFAAFKEHIGVATRTSLLRAIGEDATSPVGEFEQSTDTATAAHALGARTTSEQAGLARTSTTLSEQAGLAPSGPTRTHVKPP